MNNKKWSFQKSFTRLDIILDTARCNQDDLLE
jgi:hypothetical protein